MIKHSIYFLFILVLWGGELVAQAGIEKYSRVKILLQGRTMADVAILGLAVDHGEYRKGESFTTDLSASEIDFLKQNQIGYEIIIDDVVLHYIKESNALVQPSKKSRAINCTPTITFPTPVNFNYGSMGGYYTYQQALAHLDSLASKFPNIVKAKAQIDTFSSIQGRPMYWMKISDNPNSDENEPEVLITSVHHAREPLGLTQLIFFMYYLCENYNTNAEVQYFVNNSELYLVPLVNPDGYVYNQTTNPNGGGMWRKNRRANANGTFGVDLNRNYGYFWGFNNVGSSPTPSSETYRGTAGFSEPETRAVKYLCEQHQFRMALNYHTYGNLLIYPWGYIDSHTSDSLQFQQYTKMMTNYNRFVYGTGTETVGYTTNGDSDDWMYGETGTKNKILSLTPEVGEGNYGFWPPQNIILPYCNLNMHTNMNFMRCALAYADCDDIGSRFLYPVNADVKFVMFKKGMSSNAIFTVSIIPLTNNITAGAPKVYNNLPFLSSQLDSIPLIINPGTVHGDAISYILRINNGYVNYDDTVTKYFSTYTQTEFASNCNSLSGWTATGTWGSSTQFFTSPAASLTESPAGNYTNSTTSRITTTLPINLTQAIRADLKFRIKWYSECNLDYLQVKVSNNGGATYSSICTRYAMKSVAPAILNQPAYDGVQWEWQFDEANLDAFIGQNILLRFEFVSDGGLTKNGFFIDDVRVETIQNANFPLAVHMSPLELRSENCHVRLKWTTYNEYQTDRFEIERSIDGIHFESIGTVVAKGNSTKEVNYEYTDTHAINGMFQYRLRALDTDGSEQFSNTAVIDLNCPGTTSALYPNPAGSYVNVLLRGNNGEHCYVRVCDVYGNTLLEKEMWLDKGVTSLKIETNSWAPGTYIVSVNKNGVTETLRFLKW